MGHALKKEEDQGSISVVAPITYAEAAEYAADPERLRRDSGLQRFVTLWAGGELSSREEIQVVNFLLRARDNNEIGHELRVRLIGQTRDLYDRVYAQA